MRDILLALCGTSPAVITETVWAMARETPARIPAKVVVLTTSMGRDSVRDQLIHSAVWDALRTTLTANDSQLCFGDTTDSIRVFTDRSGRSELVDIASDSDGVAAGDFILDNLRGLVETPGTRVTCSIAGGRKTMSALAALAMTLLGREQDRLCHVLVRPPFDDPELKPRFYFPQGLSHETRSGKKISDSAARIRLHEIPFVRCRSVYRREYGRLPGTFAETVALANQRLAADDCPRVRIDPYRKNCEVDGKALRLSDDEFDLFWMLLVRAAEERPPVDNAYCLYDELRAFVDDRRGEKMGAPSDANQAKARRLASRIKEKLQALGCSSRIDALFPSQGRGRGYALEIPPDQIDGLDSLTR